MFRVSIYETTPVLELFKSGEVLVIGVKSFGILFSVNCVLQIHCPVLSVEAFLMT